MKIVSYHPGRLIWLIAQISVQRNMVGFVVYGHIYITKICCKFPFFSNSYTFNRCGSTGIKRCHMSRHRSRCPQEPMECPFAEAGCEGDLRRCEFDGHMTSEQQEHLLLVMKGYKEMKKRLGEVEEELKETKKQLKALKSRR